jgi:2,5-furandicarboxylate decarboxylase 1
MNLREFMSRLESGGHLKRVKREVQLKYELASVVVKSDVVGGPALLFENISGSRIPVVAGLLSDNRRVAVALNVPQDGILSKISTSLNSPIPPTMVEKGECKERIHHDVDLLKMFPIPIHAEKDAGPYLSAAVVTSLGLENGDRSLSYCRLLVKGRNKLGINIDPPRRLKRHLELSDSRGKDLPIGICIGCNPAVELAAASKTVHDKIAVAGGMQGEPIRMVKCETSDVQVPADTEIVLEGRILANIREPEGPFAEFAGYYGEVRDRPVVEIDCVTTRSNPIFRTIVGSGMEHLILGNVVAREPVLYQFVKHTVPTTKAVHIPPHSSGFIAVISIDKKVEGEARNAMMAAFASHPNIKYVIVVDDDVDIFNPRDVEWALATRSQGHEDIIIIPEAWGHWMDPSSRDGVSSKVGIDATIPLEIANKEKFTRVRFPGIDKIDLNSYIS